MQTIELGYFGNVWIRMQMYKRAHERHEGHKHLHDHISLLVSGGLRVEVEGKESFEVHAGSADKPTFFEVPAEHSHTLIPLKDNTVAYCIFAIRDEDGNLVDDPKDSDTSQYTRIKEKHGFEKLNR